MSGCRVKLQGKPKRPCEHTPGSKDALRHGCTCAVIDNHHGEGFPYGGQTCWYITFGCPCHTGRNDEQQEKS